MVANKELTDAQAIAGATLAIAASNLAAAILAKRKAPDVAEAISVWRDVLREMQHSAAKAKAPS